MFQQHRFAAWGNNLPLTQQFSQQNIIGDIFDTMTLK